jgi:hypothetical protein
LDISINTHWSPTNSTQISFFVLFSYKIKVHCGFGGWVGRCIHFVHLAKMEFKLKLCSQNDLIRFIGDTLDKISKLILVWTLLYCFSYSLCPFSAKCTCTKLVSLFSPFYLNLPKVDFLYVFVFRVFWFIQYFNIQWSKNNEFYNISTSNISCIA